MSMSKKIITNYPRKNTDWKYINYLEDTIKELKQELEDTREEKIKWINRSYKKDNILILKDLKIEQYQSEIEQLKNSLQYYKQSLL